MLIVSELIPASGVCLSQFGSILSDPWWEAKYDYYHECIQVPKEDFGCHPKF